MKPHPAANPDGTKPLWVWERATNAWSNVHIPINSICGGWAKTPNGNVGMYSGHYQTLGVSGRQMECLCVLLCGIPACCPACRSYLRLIHSTQQQHHHHRHHHHLVPPTLLPSSHTKQQRRRRPRSTSRRLR